LSDVYATDPARVETSAAEAMEILRRRSAALPHAPQRTLTTESLLPALAEWRKNFDPLHGGDRRAPKFPMPGTLRFLLRCSEVYADTDTAEAGHIRDHVHRTLTKMALGGIFDHLNGGFARYSTDERWKVPHFEKMLYDNAQLIGVYADAYRSSGIGLYREVVERTIAYVETALGSRDGLFAAAMDADSDGKEGAYFVWGTDELERLLGADAEVFARVYHIRFDEVFEDGLFILHRSQTDEQAAEECGMDVESLRSLLERCHVQLRAAQLQRLPPERDENIICSWNALMVSAYVHAHRALHSPALLSKAQKLFDALRTHATSPKGTLMHICSLQTLTPGFLEDHACMMQAAADLYSATCDDGVLAYTEELISSVDTFFTRTDSPLCAFTPNGSDPLILPTTEVYDNVIPSSNAMLARALYDVGIMTGSEDAIRRAETMLRAVAEQVCRHPSSFAHWATLLLDMTSNTRHVTASGAGAEEAADLLYHAYLPNVHVRRHAPAIVPESDATPP
ncbi:MAG: thioredoxin domain-containing protein, partial [Candidatus Kapaibacterium sp.]